MSSGRQARDAGGTTTTPPPKRPKPRRSPTTQMIFDSCQDQLAQAAELHDAGLLDEKMLTDMKSKAVARYQSSLDDRATQKLSQSTVSGGGVSEDDEEEPPSKRSRQQRSDTPASGRNSSSGSSGLLGFGIGIQSLAIQTGKNWILWLRRIVLCTSLSCHL